ncbi:tetratricopeptide repeat protein, partial [Escherichia coli]|uniref:tetratricopeptide repeat protein n=1 Tax=Escherichia coli TaxID=562 RepID=UPI001E54E478
EWYQKAAEQGHAEAQFQLGRLYAFSDLRNDALAVEWFLCAAKQDHSSAQFKLGWMYQLGMGVEQSDRQAFHWFILAAEQDHAGAQASLGEMYKNGWGVEQDDVAAQDWFYRARTMHDHSTRPVRVFLRLRVRGLRSWLLLIRNMKR